ncbi:MAG: TIGR01777 family oxidoreductase [Candidatus Brocadiia bacterium]
MRVLITGSHGLIGSALADSLRDTGHSTTPLVRSQARQGEVRWDPAAGAIDAAGLERHDAAVHLAGESILGRWTAAKKARIRSSRVDGTRLLCQTLAGLEHPPGAVLVASATGYYGDRGSEVLTEESEAGRGFLAEVCRAWEAAAEPARRRGIRVVHLRFGVVLSARGGALAAMLPPFRLGLGGAVGSGRQYLSWIALDDAVGAIRHALVRETLSGAVNVVSPHPVTNRELAKTLGRVLRRPAVLPLPAFVLRLVYGEMADATLLSGVRARPARLVETGYAFRHPRLEAALRFLLGRS